MFPSRVGPGCVYRALTSRGYGLRLVHAILGIRPAPRRLRRHDSQDRMDQARLRREGGFFVSMRRGGRGPALGEGADRGLRRAACADRSEAWGAAPSDHGARRASLCGRLMGSGSQRDACGVAPSGQEAWRAGVFGRLMGSGRQREARGDALLAWARRAGGATLLYKPGARRERLA